MNREEIQKLLGGYATGTLTAEEQGALFAAALEDQELFDALGREQALRDLLRDPGNRAELLAVLATPAREGGGFWAWLRRPLAVGLACGALTGIMGLTVWQVTHRRQAAPAPAILAEMKAPERNAPQAIETQSPDAATKTFATQNTAAQATAAQATALQAPAIRKPEFASLREGTDTKPERSKKEPALPVDTPAASPAAAPPPAPPRAFAVTLANRPGAANQTVEVTADASSLGVKPPAAEAAPIAALETLQPNKLQDKLSSAGTGGRTGLRTDARTLFYGNMFIPRPNALVQPLAAGGQPQGAPRGSGMAVGAATGNLARQGSATSSLGVRVSILRGDEEAAVTTILNAGESVRLKLTPNEDGFLYVATREGNLWKMVASGPVQRLKPFETPPLPFSGSGTKQLYVMLSREAQTLSPQALPGMARNNLVETLADQDRATYVVAAVTTDAPQQVVQPITLTYR